jgi:hypothetical protein
MPDHALPDIIDKVRLCRGFFKIAARDLLRTISAVSGARTVAQTGREHLRDFP